MMGKRTPFHHLSEFWKYLCLEATHYRSSLSWQTCDGALQHMITNLEKTKENLWVERSS